MALKLESLSRIAILDTEKRAILGYVPYDDPGCLFATNAERLILVEPSARIVRSYRLVDLEVEAERSLSPLVTSPILAIGGGAGATGPFFLCSCRNPQTEIFAVDPNTLEQSRYDLDFGDPNRSSSYVPAKRVLVSADGSVFTSGSQGDGSRDIMIASALDHRLECRFADRSANYAIPDDFGQRIYTDDGVFNARGERVGNRQAEDEAVYAIPAIGGPFWLATPKPKEQQRDARIRRRRPEHPSPPADAGAQQRVDLYVAGSPGPLASYPVSKFRFLSTHQLDPYGRPTIHRRLIFLAEAKVIAEVADPPDQVILHSVDVDQLLTTSPPESPILLSLPPKSVRLGEPLRHQMLARCRGGRPTFKLDAGPKGMTLSADGLLEWNCQNRPASGAVSAVVSVTGAGLTTPYSFSIFVVPRRDLYSAEEGCPPEVFSRDRHDGDIRLQLPAPWGEVCVAGDGRFLVLELDRLRKLAILDTTSGKIVGYIPFDGAKLFAGGLQKLIVIDPARSSIERFDLATQKLEKTQRLPTDCNPTFVAMGSASSGPVLIGIAHSNESRYCLFDLDTLLPLKFEMLGGGPNARFALASGDGRVFGVRGGVLAFNGHSLNCSLPNAGVSWLMPDQVGDRVYSENRVFNAQARHLIFNPPPDSNINFVPAVHGPFVLQVRFLLESTMPGAKAPRMTAGVCLVDETEPFVSLGGISLDNASGSHPRSIHGMPGRLRLIPNLKMLIMLPDGDTLLFRPIDLEKALQSSKRDYLIIASQPPRSISVGQTLQYQIVVATNRGKPRFQLQSGPQGMSVSDTGMVHWRVTSPLEGGLVSAILNVDNGAGHSALHSFLLDVKPKSSDEKDHDTGDSDIVSSPFPAWVTQNATLQPPIQPSPSEASPEVDVKEICCKLPSPYNRITLAANKSMLVLHMPLLGKLALVGLRSGKVLCYLPTDGDEGVLFAAGAKKLIVVNPTTKTASRYRLTDGQAEQTAVLDVPNEIIKVVVDADSAERLIVFQKGEPKPSPAFFDIESFKPLKIEGQSDASSAQNKRARINSNGRSSSFAGDMGMDWYDKTIGGGNGLPPGQLISATHGPLYLCVSRERPLTNVYVVGDLSPLVEVPCFAGDLKSDVFHGNSLSLSINDRVFFAPDDEYLAWLPTTNDRVIVRRFKLNEELERRGRPYLAVVSRPPEIAQPGKTFEYQLDIRTDARDVKCTLDSGPDGMSVSKEGLVRWHVADPPSEKQVSACITVTNESGQSKRHVFVLLTGEHVEQAPPHPPALVANRKRVSATQAPPAVPPKPPAAPRDSSEGAVALDDRHLRLPARVTAVVPGLNRKSMLLLHGIYLSILGENGSKVVRNHTLKGEYLRIAERADYYVALAANAPSLDLLDRKTLAPIRRIPLKVAGPTDLAIHPSRPISYVAATTSRSDFENGSFVVVNETDSTVREDAKQYLGQWLQIDAAGERLVSAGRITQSVGSTLVVSPRRGPPRMNPFAPHNPSSVDVHVVPDRANGEVLCVYDLEEDGTPRISDVLVSIRQEACGLRITRDGLRGTIVRGEGPMQVMNLDALDEKPVEFSFGRNRVNSIAHHPALPLIACIGSAEPCIFDQETGTAIPKALALSKEDLMQGTSAGVWFSADGKNLLMHTESHDYGSRLTRIELNLSPDDLAKVRTRVANMESLGRNLFVDRPSRPGQGKVPLKDLDAFQGGRSQEMNAKETGRLFTDAVVVVHGEEMSGSGFVVGSRGYVVTCAHCVPKAGRLRVSYRANSGADVSMKETSAKALYTDHRNDLALLQLSDAPTLTPVRLAIGEKVESGERVTVIGNPGVGQKILDYTMTEGIVSNPRRSVGRHVLVQTSAAVNPGSSGAPLFNSKGLVVGMVVMKAGIENTGFAIPADDLGAFLALSADAKGPAAEIERHWFDVGDKHQTVARYLGMQGESVQLRRADGTPINVSLAKLSPRDVAFVRLLNPNENVK